MCLKISLSVDDRHHERYLFAKDVQFLVPAEVYLGGTQNTYASTNGRVLHNFNGALAQVKNLRKKKLLERRAYSFYFSWFFF